MLIEAFLAKIVGGVFAKSMLGGALKTGFEIYSAFELLDRVSDCVDACSSSSDLGICAAHAVSAPLSERAVEKLLSTESTPIEVKRAPSGVYIASRVAPTFESGVIHLPRAAPNFGSNAVRVKTGSGTSVSVSSTARVSTPTPVRIRVN